MIFPTCFPVVTNLARPACASEEFEMENRMNSSLKVGARNFVPATMLRIAEYNAQSEYKTVPTGTIVVIVDELADLMMVVRK